MDAAGHLCLFLPKYHCECNYIERYWGAVKKYCRRHCGYSLPALIKCLPIALSQTLEELPEELRDDPNLPALEAPAGGRHVEPPRPSVHEQALSRGGLVVHRVERARDDGAGRWFEGMGSLHHLRSASCPLILPVSTHLPRATLHAAA